MLDKLTKVMNEAEEINDLVSYFITDIYPEFKSQGWDLMRPKCTNPPHASLIKDKNTNYIHRITFDGKTNELEYLVKYKNYSTLHEEVIKTETKEELKDCVLNFITQSEKFE